MTSWTITQPETGVILGVFQGSDEREALLAMAKSVGYDSIDEMDDVVGGDSLEDLLFTHE